MDVPAWIQQLQLDRRYCDQLVRSQMLPEQSGRFAQPQRPLPEELQRLLCGKSISTLYEHQARAVDLTRAGTSWVVVTGTASGKTLCYNLPILESCLQAEATRALYLFPTKALAQDQLRGLEELLDKEPEVAQRVRAGVYDGDTPVAERRRIKAEANLILSNPDMLHASILPYHPKWSRFFSELRYVVLDEVHSYRGILGANVSCVLRRLRRVCRHYGSDPVFLAASATIANPGELVERLVGQPVEVIDCDGAPRGKKYFLLWNPNPYERHEADGRSAADDAVWLMTSAITQGAQTLAFTRTRQAAELVHRYVREALEAESSPLARKVRAYRGGYLPDERRRMEQDLFQGNLRGVAATNALELGIDIGSLDVAILVQYPGTIASTWQQAGRSGRRHDESVAVLIAGNDPVDQFLLRYPDYFFQQSPEFAVVDPENPYVLAKHLPAAAFELPLDEPALRDFGSTASFIAEALDHEQQLTQVDQRYYFSGGQNPAQTVSLRHMSDNTFSIVLREQGASERKNQVIGNVDAISAPELIYPQAVYLHDGQTYFVRELDLNGRVAYVERHEMDYYTQAILESKVKIEETQASCNAIHQAVLEFGQVDVSWKTVAFKKIKFETRENIGFGSVDIPAQNLPTTAFWLAPDDATRSKLKQAGYRSSEALCGLRNLAIVSLPMIAMCDSRDLSGVVDSQNLGRSCMIIYDRYPGGLGYSEQGFYSIHAMLQLCWRIVADCPCDDGCPSCVGLPNLRPAIHSDPDLMRGYPIPDKQATLYLLEQLGAAQPNGNTSVMTPQAARA